VHVQGSADSVDCLLLGKCHVRFTPSRVEDPKHDSFIVTKDLSLEERAVRTFYLES
jgi:hypothetical protein